MGERGLKFRHEVIDADPPGSEHDITLIADLTGNGRNDIIIGGKKGPPNLFWYENPSWARHAMADAPELEALFPEFAPHLPDCRFKDCLHRDEEGCGIHAAVESGKISLRRYLSYLKMYDEAMQEPSRKP